MKRVTLVVPHTVATTGWVGRSSFSVALQAQARRGSVSGMVPPSSVTTLMFAPPGSSGAILTQPVASADAPSARPTQECVRFDRRDALVADDRTPQRRALAGTSAEQNRRSAARSLPTPLRSSGARMSFREPYDEGHSYSSAGSSCFRRKPRGSRRSGFYAPIWVGVEVGHLSGPQADWACRSAHARRATLPSTVAPARIGTCAASRHVWRHRGLGLSSRGSARGASHLDPHPVGSGPVG